MAHTAIVNPNEQARERLPLDCSIPLVVDLDGTLLLTDSLHESFVSSLFRSFGVSIVTVLKSLRNRADAKRYLTERSFIDVTVLPTRGDLLELLRAEHDRGREIHLVTAADQAIVDRVRTEFDFFASVVGSDGMRNLKGEAKLAYLQGRFPGGFIYAGDSVADQPIFRASRGAILCDLSPDITRILAAAGTPVLAEFTRAGPSLPQWLMAMRPHQWSKNVLIFVPLVVGHGLLDGWKLTATALGFVILCVLASGTYILNDLADLDADRRHPTKRYRPFASGHLSIRYGLAVAAVMIFASLAAALVLSRAFAITSCGYLALTTLYSFRLKQIPLLDVFVIGTLLTSRIVMGADLASLAPSAWLLAFSMLFFFSLALSKRHVELMRMEQNGRRAVSGRGYCAEDWPLTLVFGIGAGMASIIIMLLYIANDAAPSGFYHQIAWLYVVPAAVILWLERIWFLSHRAALDDDPVVFALRDPTSWLLGIVVGVAIALAI
jgi:4-hydroxybenzoate polyprenyltransferase